MAERVIKSVDMTEEMAEEIFRIAQEGIEKNSVHQEAALMIKKESDRKFGPAW